MNNFFLVLFASVFFVSNSLSQTCNGDFSLNSQAAVDAFSCTTIVDGNLSIESLNQISNLAGLSELESIGGDLTIRNLNNLTSLNGLENLESIEGDLLLSFLPGVTDFSGLDNLVMVNNVTLEFLNGVTDLDILNSVETIDNLLIRLNDNLETVSGFGSFDGAEAITVRQNPLLINLPGLTNVTSLFETTIQSNPSLDACVFLAPLLLSSNPPIATISDNKDPGCCSSTATVVSSACFVQCPSDYAVGNSLSFDGTDDYVNINAALAGLDGISDFAVEFWMKADAANVSGPRSMMFAHNAPAPGQNKFLLILNGSSIAFPGRLTILDEDNGFEYTSEADVGDNLWHHIAYSRENGIGSLYIDGAFDGNHPSVTTFAADDRLSLGQEFDGNSTSDFFNGNLADVRIWASPRSASQIMASQQSELSGVVEDLVAYYKFEGDGTSQSSTDCTPNSFDGSRIGANGMNNLPQFVADMPCIENHACSEVIFPSISISKAVSDYTLAPNGNVFTTFEIAVVNDGTAELFDLGVFDDLTGQLGTAFVQTTTPVLTFVSQPTSTSLTANNAYDGSSMNLLTAGQSIAAGESFILAVQVELDVTEISSSLSNIASVSSNTAAGGGGVVAQSTSISVTLSDCFANVSGSLTCNTSLQLSVDTDPTTCQGTLDPTTLLEGEDENCFGPGAPLEGFFRISLSTTPNGPAFVVSDSDVNPLTTDVLEFDFSQYLGQTVFWTLTASGPNPNSCSGPIFIEDRAKPVLATAGPVDFTVTCIEDITNLNLPVVTDNCGMGTAPLNLVSAIPFNVIPCGPNGEILTIVRTYNATDASGNVSDPFTQTITVVQATPTIPLDVTYSCEEYALDNSIVQPTATGAGIPNVFDVTTGLGTCNFDVTFADEIVAVCGSISERFSIRRTWTILNDCSNDPPIIQVQNINVLDAVAPVITVPATFIIEANVAGVGGHNTCTSSGLLPVPTLSDNCSGIDAATLTVNTPAGQAMPIVAGGQIIGYEIPPPFLMLGGPHTISYTVMDSCENTTTVDMQVSVLDNTPPVATCDELTTFSLTTTSATALPAATLDDGSSDLCNGTVYFKILRMDEATGTPVACSNANVNSPAETAANLVYFDDEAFFCCDDIASSPIMVMLRVFDVDPGFGPVAPSRMELGGDLFGRFNDCMVEVTVQDKLAPQLDCPAPRTIVCTDLATMQQYTDQNNTAFDAPIVIDACATTTTLSINDATSSCGNGTITRTFTVADNQGNSSTCSQLITVILEHDYSIVWPSDVDVEICQIGVFGDTLMRPNSLIENGCDLLAVSYTDRRFETQNNGCYKILRTYDVINWCEWDGVSAAIAVPNPPNSTGGPRLDVTVTSGGNQTVLVAGQPLISPASSPNQVTSVGRWNYTQIIKVYDNQDPVLSNISAAACNPATPTPGLACGQAVSVSFDLTDNCGDLYPITYQLVEGVTDTNGDGQISSTELAQGTLLGADPYGILIAPAGSTNNTASAGTFTIAGNYPLGSYVAILDVRDLCGNVAELYVPFTSEDCKAPSPFGIDVTVGIMATGMINVWASDVENPNSASFDACSAVRLSFSSDVNDTVRTYTCVDIGDQLVQLWVTDMSGNQSFVSVTVTVEDQLGHCTTGPAPRTIAGTIASPVGAAVQHVHVSAQGGYLSDITTSSNGQYAFYRINNGANVTVTPQRLDLPYAGITTYDLYLIGQHVLGNSLLISPQQLIAADASNNGQITAFDMTTMRRVVLGLDSEFPNNTSWRFIQSSYTFPNPANPWQEVFPESYHFDPLSQNMMNSDFTAIKIGDVNSSAAANSNQVLAPRTLTGVFALESKDAELSKGEQLSVEFTASDVNVLGYQLTLEWNPLDIEVVRIQDGAHPASGFGKHLLQKGKLTMSHNGNMQGKLFGLDVRALRNGVTLSESFRVGSSVTVAEAFAKTGEQAVALRFSGVAPSSLYALEQNRPNPFNGSTQISFTLAEPGVANLTVTDVTGRVVWQASDLFDSGRSQIEIEAKDLPVAGLLNYTLTAGEFTATRKMVVVR